MIPLDKSKQYEVQDEHGKWHDVRLGAMNQIYRDAHTGPRIVLSIILYVLIMSAVKNNVNSLISVLTIAVALILILRFFILQIVVDEDERKTLKERKQ